MAKDFLLPVLEQIGLPLPKNILFTDRESDMKAVLPEKHKKYCLSGGGGPVAAWGTDITARLLSA